MWQKNPGVLRLRTLGDCAHTAPDTQVAGTVSHQVFNEASQDSPGAETRIWHRVRIARRKSLWEWTVGRQRAH